MSVITAMGLGQDFALETMTQAEQRHGLATAAFEVAEIWAHGVSPRLTPAERVHGAVHAVLDLLENGGNEVPSFLLTPVLREEHESITTVTRDGGEVEADWDAGVPMDLHGGDHEYSTTQIYQQIYDSYRDRYTIAAHELFGKP